jgi:hypothetical protein
MIRVVAISKQALHATICCSIAVIVVEAWNTALRIFRRCRTNSSIAESTTIWCTYATIIVSALTTTFRSRRRQGASSGIAESTAI